MLNAFAISARNRYTVFEAGCHGGLARLGQAIVQLLRFGKEIVGVRHAAQAIALQGPPVATAQLCRVVVAVLVLDGDKVRNGLCADLGFSLPERSEALLSKSNEGRSDAICGSFYNTGTVIGVPSRVKRLSTAARICNSAT